MTSLRVVVILEKIIIMCTQCYYTNVTGKAIHIFHSAGEKECYTSAV